MFRFETFKCGKENTGYNKNEGFEIYKIATKRV